MAVHKVQLGEASRAAQTLTAGKLASGTPATLSKLTHPQKRPRALAPGDELPDEEKSFVPEVPVKLDEKLFLSVLRCFDKESKVFAIFPLFSTELIPLSLRSNCNGLSQNDMDELFLY